MAISHTPGPWEVHQLPSHTDEIDNVQEIWSDDRQTLVASCIWDKDDARLIAAAPDLLEALEAVLEGLELRGLLSGWDHDPKMVERIRAAISKAKPLRRDEKLRAAGIEPRPLLGQLED